MTVDGGALPPLPDDLFLDLAERVYSECGLRFDQNNRFLFHKRLAGRLASLGLETLRDYHLFLKFDPRREEEFTALHSVLTISETYFMREKGALHACAERAAAEIPGLRAAGRRFRIWSAGCASGEEPYGLAMLLTGKGLTGRDFEIIGSDISDRALARAREATYTVHSFRFLDEKFRLSYFDARPDGRWTLRDPWRTLVTFTGVNLYHDPRLPLFGQFDAVFCRNVLIYFDNESKLAVLKNLHGRLRDDGRLFIGSSESLLTLDSPFRLNRLGGEFAYCK